MGQVWEYDPGPARLTLRYESPGAATMDMVDGYLRIFERVTA